MGGGGVSLSVASSALSWEFFPTAVVFAVVVSPLLVLQVLRLVSSPSLAVRLGQLAR